MLVKSAENAEPQPQYLQGSVVITFAPNFRHGLQAGSSQPTESNIGRLSEWQRSTGSFADSSLEVQSFGPAERHYTPNQLEVDLDTVVADDKLGRAKMLDQLPASAGVKHREDPC